ncbi:MAG: DUF1922 domain-containing protein [Planctomycetota bacterium]
MKHLLRCDCGSDLVVEPHQAGETINCECGKALAVPALRRLRELPVAVAESPEVGSGWSFRAGVLTAGVVIASIFAAACGYVRLSEPPAPDAFDAGLRTDRFEENFGRLTPAQAYQLWGQNYQLLDKIGFSPMQDPRRDAVLGQIRQARALEAVLLAIAAVAAVGSGIVYAALPAGKN